MNIPQLARRSLKVALYGAALAAPVVVVAAVNAWSAMANLTAPPRSFTVPQVAPPAHDPAKPTVVVLASNNGTEISDLLAPYAVFAAAEAFNVYTAAPERTFTPFMWGGVDFVPHYSFAELDALLQTAPDVIVIPYIKDHDNRQIVDYIRNHAGTKTLVVSICGGAYVLAATGLVDGAKVTTHTSVFPLIAKEYPQVELVRDVRWTDNGLTITSAGITAGIDASLHAIDRLLGRTAALATAARIHYPHTRFLDDPAYVLPSQATDTLLTAFNVGFSPGRTTIGVYLPEGVDELALTAALDTYGRTFTATTHTFAPERTVVRSRFGLDLVPRDSFATMPAAGRLIVPASGLPQPEAANLDGWVRSTARPPVEYLFGHATADARPMAGSTFAFDTTLADLSRWHSQADMRASANSLEYPIEHLSLPASAIAAQRFALPAALGLAGVALAALVRRWFDSHSAMKAGYAGSARVTRESIA